MKALPRKVLRSNLRTLVTSVVSRLPDANGIVRFRRDSLWDESANIEYSVLTEYPEWTVSPDTVLWLMAFKLLDDHFNSGKKPVVGKASYVKKGKAHEGNAQTIGLTSVSRLIPLVLRYRQLRLRALSNQSPAHLSVKPLDIGSSVMPGIVFPAHGVNLLKYKVEDDTGHISLVPYIEEHMFVPPRTRGSDSFAPKKKVNEGRRDVMIVLDDGFDHKTQEKLKNLSRLEFTQNHLGTLRQQEKKLQTGLDIEGSGRTHIKSRIKRLTQLRSKWSGVNETDKKLLKWWRGQKETDRRVLNQKMRRQFEELWAGQELVLYPRPQKGLFDTPQTGDLWAQLRLAMAPRRRKNTTFSVGEHTAWGLRPRPTAKWAWSEAVQWFFEVGYGADLNKPGAKVMKASGQHVERAYLPVNRNNRWTSQMLDRVEDLAQQILADTNHDPLDLTKVVITYEDFFFYCLSFARKLHRNNPRRNMSDVILDVAQYLVGSLYFALYQWSSGDKLDRRTGKLRNQWWRLGLSESELEDLEREMAEPKKIGYMPPRAFETLYTLPKKRVPKDQNGEFAESRWSEADWWDYEYQLREIPWPTRDKDGKVTGLGYARRFLMMAGATLYELTDELYGKPRMLLIKQRDGSTQSLKRKGHDGKAWLSKIGSKIEDIKPIDETEITGKFKYVEVPTYDNIPDYNDPTGRKTKRVLRTLTVSQVRRKDGQLEFVEAVEAQRARMASAGKDGLSDPEENLERKAKKTLVRRALRIAINCGHFTPVEIESIKHYFQHGEYSHGLEEGHRKFRRGEFLRGDKPARIYEKIREIILSLGSDVIV